MSESHIWFIIAAIWLVSAFAQAGITVAYFENEFQYSTYRENLAFAFCFGCLGPVALILAFFLSGFCNHGWQLTPTKSEKRGA